MVARRSRSDHMDVMDEYSGSCPECHTGDLISITMTVSGRDLSFTTCHLCEAKWWYEEGKLVPLGTVIGLVASPRA